MSQPLPSSLKLRVISSLKLLVDEEVEEVSLPGLDGCLGILPGHRHLVVALGRGRLAFRKAQKQEAFPIEGGFAEVFPERVTVFTEYVKEEPDEFSEGQG